MKEGYTSVPVASTQTSQLPGVVTVKTPRAPVASVSSNAGAELAPTVALVKVTMLSSTVESQPAIAVPLILVAICGAVSSARISTVV